MLHACSTEALNDMMLEPADTDLKGLQKTCGVHSWAGHAEPA